MIKKRVLTKLGVKEERAEKFLPDLKAILPEHQIHTPLRFGHFLAQVLHESAMMRAVKENLNYSASALLEVFKKYFKTATEAERYARKPRMIANKVYAGRMGNGDEASGDGFRYRGRGLIQLTGKNNYRKFSKWIDDDLVANPELVATQYAVHSAVYFWATKKLNDHADVDDIKRITKIINGGYNGLAHRKELLQKAKEVLGVEPSAPLGEKSVKGATHKVTASSLRLRPQPKASPAIASIQKGTKVKKIRASPIPGWVQVQVLLNGRVTKGYVSSQYLQALPRPIIPPSPQPCKLTGGMHRVTATSLRLRRQPKTTTNNVIASLPKGHLVKPLKNPKESEWVKLQVDLNGKLTNGFVVGKYLQPIDRS